MDRRGFVNAVAAIFGALAFWRTGTSVAGDRPARWEWVIDEYRDGFRYWRSDACVMSDEAAAIIASIGTYATALGADYLIIEHVYAEFAGKGLLRCKVSLLEPERGMCVIPRRCVIFSMVFPGEHRIVSVGGKDVA